MQRGISHGVWDEDGGTHLIIATAFGVLDCKIGGARPHMTGTTTGTRSSGETGMVSAVSRCFKRK
jgi:hypothetical protein